MLVQRVIGRHQVMSHSLIGREVVLGSIDRAGLQRRVYVRIDDGHRLRSQAAHHVLHVIGILHPDLHPPEISDVPDGLL